MWWQKSLPSVADIRFSSKVGVMIEDFQNADHLNLGGAEKFSAIIRDDFVSRYINPIPAALNGKY
jgi:hypothetical protein